MGYVFCVAYVFSEAFELIYQDGWVVYKLNKKLRVESSEFRVMNSEFIIQNEERTIEYNDFNSSRMRESLLKHYPNK